MRNAPRTSTLRRGDVTIREWLVVACVGIITVVIGNVSKLTPKWEHALVYTVLVFTAVVIGFRAAWHRTAFWVWVLSIFLAHALSIYFVTRALSPASEGPQGLLFILSGLTEGGVIGLILLKILDNRAT